MPELKEFLQDHGCSSPLTEVFVLIADAVREVAEVVRKGSGELAGSANTSGEPQLALDVKANEIFRTKFKESGIIGRIASEEIEEVEKFSDEGVLIAFDPLDGSSLVDVNFAVGSIFGVYESGEFIGKKGDDQIGAAFAVYGPRTTFVLTFKSGTHEFQLENDRWILRTENIEVNKEAKHFSPGNLRAANELDNYMQLLEYWVKNGYTLRYSGGMVPDINHILAKKGGIFTYPAYSKAPNGKLRLLYECAPMALLMEQAGGAAVCNGTGNDKGRILDITISELHQRTPIYIGSVQEVERSEIAFSKNMQ